MVNDLLLLGLLSTGPKHGYQIKKLLREINRNFIKIDTTSIYYPLRQLEKRSLVSRQVGRKGRRPEKYIYQLTDSGKGALNRLILRNLLALERPFINFDLALYFAPLLKKRSLYKCFRERLRGLKKVKAWLTKISVSARQKTSTNYLRAIINHNLQLVKTEIKFTQAILEAAKGEFHAKNLNR